MDVARPLGLDRGTQQETEVVELLNGRASSKALMSLSSAAASHSRARKNMALKFCMKAICRARSAMSCSREPSPRTSKMVTPDEHRRVQDLIARPEQLRLGADLEV
jgi:hypothetical protein